jgi:hypothetical protein
MQRFLPQHLDRKDSIMGSSISLTSIGIILLDVLLVWACFSVDKHLKFLDAEDMRNEEEDERRLRLIPLFPEALHPQYGRDALVRNTA